MNVPAKFEVRLEFWVGVVSDSVIAVALAVSHVSPAWSSFIFLIVFLLLRYTAVYRDLGDTGVVLSFKLSTVTTISIEVSLVSHNTRAQTHSCCECDVMWADHQRHSVIVVVAHARSLNGS